MDKVVDARFERVEKALAVLIESIGKYNPSVQSGIDLALADQELSDGLRQVETHQNNVLRIQQLRAASASLDGQIRDTLQLLASTRKDMTTTPATVFPDRTPNPVSFEDLLSFARRISKTTMPPAGVTNGVDLDLVSAAAAAAAATGDMTPGAAQTPTALQSTAPTPTATNGATTPAAAPPTPGGANHQQQHPLGAGGVGPPAPHNSALAVPESFTQWMNPHTGAVFFPWPREDQIRGGALMANQRLAESGVEIRGYDPVEEARLREAALAEARRLEEERATAEQAAHAERDRRRREELERHRAEREQEQREAFRRGSMALDTSGAGLGVSMGPGGPGGSPARPSATSPAVKQQFQFMGDDDDDDEDDSDNPLQG